MSADVAMPLRRRWGAADGPEGPFGRAACEPFAFEGSFDGVAPRRDADSSNLWSGSSWFTGGAAVEAVPSGEAAAPGGAVSQNRMHRGAAQVQPFKPTSSTQTLHEVRLDADGGAAWSAAPAFALCGARASEAATRFGPGGSYGGRICAADATPCGFVYNFERLRWEHAPEAGGAAVSPATAAAAAAVMPAGPDAGMKRMRDAATTQTADASIADEPADAALEALRALRLRRHTLASLAQQSAPAVVTPPRATRSKAAPASAARRAAAAVVASAPSLAAAHASVAEAEAVCWSQFRLSCGTVVYVRAEGVTPQLAAGWARDAAAWPAVHVLETSAAARAAAALPATMPGPRADAALEARVRDEITAWADAAAAAASECEPLSKNGNADAAAGAGAQQALVQSLFRDARHAEAAAAAARDAELAAARDWAQRLEAALAQAGIPLPPRA